MFQYNVSIEGVCAHCSKVLKMVTFPKPQRVGGVHQLVFERCSCSQPAQPLDTKELGTPGNSQRDAITFCKNEDCDHCERVFVCAREEGACDQQR